MSCGFMKKNFGKAHSQNGIFFQPLDISCKIENIL